MLSLRFRNQVAIDSATVIFASAIFMIALGSKAIIAQDSGLDPTGQVGPVPSASAQDGSVKTISAESYQALENDDTETRLMKELINSLQSEFEAARPKIAMSIDNGRQYYEVLDRLTRARLEFHKSPMEQREVLQEHLEIAQRHEAAVNDPAKAGLYSRQALYRSTAFRITAELALLRFEQGQTKSVGPEDSNRSEVEQREQLLGKELIDNLQAEFELAKMRRFAVSSDSHELLYDVVARLIDAKLTFEKSSDKQRDILREQLQIAREIEAVDKKRFEVGLSRQNEFYQSMAFRIAAELALLRFEKALSKHLAPEVDNPADGDDNEQRLLQQLIETIQSELESVRRRIESGAVDFYFLFVVERRLIEAQLQFHKEPDDQRRLLLQLFELCQKLELRVKQRYDTRMTSNGEFQRVRSDRITAELALLRFEQAQQKPSNGPEISKDDPQSSIYHRCDESALLNCDWHRSELNQIGCCRAITRLRAPLYRMGHRKFRRP